MTDDNGLRFVLDKYDELFSDNAIVFLGINNAELAHRAAANSNITGVIESTSIHETIEIAYQIHPNAKRVVALADNTPSGQADLGIFLNSQNHIPSLEYEVIDLSEITFDEFKKELNQITEDDIVLLLAVYRDTDGVTISFDEDVDTVLDNCTQPIYHNYLHGMGDGILGGEIINHYDQGAAAANILKNVLQGDDIGSYELVDEKNNRIIFDYKVMQQYDISGKSLPKDVLIFNKPKLISKRFLELTYSFLVVLLQLFVVVLLVFNVNKRRRAESRYKRFKLISDSAFNGHMITDMNDKVIYCNDYYAKAHGYSVNNVINKHSRIFHTNKQWQSEKKLKQRLIDNNYLEPVGTAHKHKNGTKFTMLVRGTVFSDKDMNEKVLVYNAIDNSKIKKLKKENDAAETATKEKSQFLANMSHEIRTPINAIIGLNTLMDNTDLTEKQKDYIDKIASSAGFLLNIINDILDISKIESGKMTIEKQRWM